jgi:hypothetical protein
MAAKGTDPQLRASGIDRFRQDIAELIPWCADRIGALHSMDDVKHLDVRLNRLDGWHVDGLLCIGDAAHAMSPIGGVGINLAVQDAVAAASLLADPLRRPRPRPATTHAPRPGGTDSRRTAGRSAEAHPGAAAARSTDFARVGLSHRRWPTARTRARVRKAARNALNPR